jgi:hypothetical protein
MMEHNLAWASWMEKMVSTMPQHFAASTPDISVLSWLRAAPGYLVWWRGLDTAFFPACASPHEHSLHIEHGRHQQDERLLRLGFSRESLACCQILK